MTKTIRLELEHDEIKAILVALAGEAMEPCDAGVTQAGRTGANS